MGLKTLLVLLIAICGGGCGPTEYRIALRQELSAPVRINAGGDATGTFSADTAFSGGNTYSTSAGIDTSAANSAPLAVYQTERYGNFDYLIGGLTAAATYTVRLHFAELYKTAIGQRAFNVDINDTPALERFDIFAAAGGGNKSVVRDGAAIADANGRISVRFTGVVDNCKVSAIEILPSQATQPTEDAGLPPAPAATAIYSVNSGGSNVGSFTADQYFGGGNVFASSNPVSTTGVANAAPAAVYQTERYGNQSYTFGGLTPNAPYAVRLHFAEIYWTAAGNRVFDVAINGSSALAGFDIFRSFGANKAGVRDFATSASTSGQIVVQFSTVIDNAKSSAIEIFSASSAEAPTAAAAAFANPNPVTGASTALGVLGADSNGESGLTYSWSTSGTPPAPALFSVNGSNAAKSTIATFAKAGSYTFVATIRNAAGQSVTSTVNVTVQQTLAAVQVSPASASVEAGAAQQFTAAARDQFANIMTTPALAWTVSGGGTINGTGAFVAGNSNGGPFTVAASAAGKTGTASVTVTSAPAPSVVPQPSDTELVVDWSSTRQKLEGFGCADPQFEDYATYDGAFSDVMADKLFSTSNGAGLSLLRVGIAPDGSNWAAWSNPTKAAARGARVWATPWSAPANMKSNGSTVNGGHLLPGSYAAWADILVAFQRTLKQQSGVDLYAISAQNEPDFAPGYFSMQYTNSEMVNFVKVLGPKLSGVSQRAKLIVGNYSNWDNLGPLVAAVEADSTALANVDFYGSNQYYGSPSAETGVRPVWEMEWSTFDAFDPSIFNAIGMAKKVHEALTTANVAAWHYWWCRFPLVPVNTGGSGDNQALFGANDESSKRLPVLGNWSRFARPGFLRMTTRGGPPGAYATAFRDPTSGAFAIVVVNDFSSARTIGISLNGANPSRVTPWRTSSSEDLKRLSSQGPSGARFSATLAASSVTTFVGNGS